MKRQQTIRPKDYVYGRDEVCASIETAVGFAMVLENPEIMEIFRSTWKSVPHVHVAALNDDYCYACLEPMEL